MIKKNSSLSSDVRYPLLVPIYVEVFVLLYYPGLVFYSMSAFRCKGIVRNPTAAYKPIAALIHGPSLATLIAEICQAIALYYHETITLSRKLLTRKYLSTIDRQT